MLFRVLGDVSVVRDGESGAIVARQRALLAVLILNANRVVGSSALVDAIWSDDQRPQHPDAALQVAMSRLRTGLGVAADRIRREGAGYRLDAGPEEVDLTRVEMLLRDGRAALALNDARRAAALFDEALSLWTGEALEDLASFPFHAGAATRVRELHFTVYEARNDAYLIDGRHLEVLDDIGDWVRAEPLREHLRAQQIAALYRSGRQADALRECTDLRKTLRDTLGIDPSAGIQELERKVLDQDPGLFATAAGLSVPLPSWTSETLSFVGREDECELAMGALRRACTDGMRFVLVEGEPGGGKSRFLLEFARRVGLDAIVLPVDVHETLRPSVMALTETLKDAAQRMRPEDVRLTLGTAPDADGAFTHWQPDVAAVMADGAQWITALSAKAPVVLLIDDLDRSGPTLLHLIGTLAASERAKRVLVVASARASTATHAPMLHTLMEALDRRDIVDRLMLHALAEHDVDSLLGRMYIAPRQTVTRKLHELTAGNPFLLAELLSTGQPERLVEVWTVPPRVRDVVLARLDELGRAAGEVLRAAAVFEREFTVPLLSTVFGIAESAMSKVVERAVDAHILQPSGLRTFRFTHELTRHTLVAELTPAERASAHRQIAVAAESVGAAAAGLALHWSQADGPDASAKTFRYARAAGDEAKRTLEPQVATRWYELALSRIGNDPDRGSLLVDLAESKQQSGDPDFAETLREAARIAQDTRDDHLLVRVVVSSSPGWSTLPGFSTDETRTLLARALDVACDDATRSRVLIRHAVEQHLDDPSGGNKLALEAIALARRSGDPVALLESLYRHAPMLSMPATLEQRRNELDEALSLAVATRDAVAQYFLTSSAVVAAVQAADLEGAGTHLAAAEMILDRCNLAPLRWSAMSRQAWQAGLAGNLDAAEQLVYDTRDFGCAHGITQAEHAALIQLAILQWHQRRALPVVSDATDEAGRIGPSPGLRHFLARALAGRTATQVEARQIVGDLAQHGFEDLPEGLFWSTNLVVTAESAFLLDLPDVARSIRRLLEPAIDQVAFSGLWVAAPIAHGVAVAAATCGDSDAEDLFEHAITIAARIDAPVLRARAQLAWAAAMRKQHPRRRPPHSATLCEEARATAQSLQLTELVRDAERLEAALSHG